MRVCPTKKNHCGGTAVIFPYEPQYGDKYSKNRLIDRCAFMPEQHGTAILQHDISYSIESVDHSVARMNQFLQEMVELTGQADCATSGVPVLELQLGDIVTFTSLSMDDMAPSLSITALLPRHKETAGEFCWSSAAQMETCAILTDGAECLWHADEGRYVMVRQVPILDLQDERSILDAILDTSDQAAMWFASISRPESAVRQ